MRLLEPIKMGNNILKNSMVMAPMTRSRANYDGIVGDSTKLYYIQRVSAGLIISEAINISKQAIGSFPMYIKTLVMTLILVPAMVYVFLPFLTKTFSKWLIK